jgi:hypothetical protein
MPSGPATRPPPAPAQSQPAASVPAGADIETPSPVPPPTIPVSFVLLSQSRTPTVTQTIDVPNQTWGMILLNYTGQAVAGVYDSSYWAAVAGVPVLFGTTPEYGQWTVLKDITEYESLLNGNVTVQFDLGTAVTSGYFLTSFSLSFYPLPPGWAPPKEPNQIVPLWPYTSETSTAPNTTTVRTVPTDVVNATLEVYAYGFTGGSADEEFWYTLSPPFRAIQVEVNGTVLTKTMPFPYINTGGIDLFAWDPITGAFTLNDPPYRMGLTAALGLLEGTHSFTLQVVGRLAPARWIAGGALLLYTNASAGPATETSYTAPTTTFSNQSAPGGLSQNVTVAYSYASAIPVGGGTEAVQASTSETFHGENTQTSTGVGQTTYSNSTSSLVASSSFRQTSSGPAGSGWLNASDRYGFSMTQFDAIVGSGKTGTDINETVQIPSLKQGWVSQRLDTEHGANGATGSGYTFANNVSVNANYKIEELVVGPGAAQIVAIDNDFENTSKTYDSTVTASPLEAYYNQTLQGTLASASAPQENVTADLVSVHDAASLAVNRSTVDAGNPIEFKATVLGAGGPFHFTWAGLPAGCASNGTAIAICASSAAGTGHASVTAIGALGNSALSGEVAWTVLPDPTAALTASAAAIDVGQNVTVTAAISGGLGPYRCAWQADGLLLQAPAPCASPTSVTYAPTSAGSFTLSLNVTDAFGRVGHASLGNLSALTDPTVALASTAPGGSLKANTSVTVEAYAAYGLPPYTYTWTENGAPVVGVTGANYTVTPRAPGQILVIVALADRAGYVVESTTTLTVTAAPGTSVPPTNNGSTSSPSAVPVEVGVVLVAVLVVVALVALRGRRPRQP